MVCFKKKKESANWISFILANIGLALGNVGFFPSIIN